MNFTGSVEYTEEDRLEKLSAEQEAAGEKPAGDVAAEESEELENQEVTEEEGQEEGNEEEGVAEDTEPIRKVKYTDPITGDEIEEEVPEETLTSAYLTVKSGKRILSPEEEEALSEVKPYLQRLNKSELLRTVDQYVAYYQAANWTEDQIKAGLAQLWAQDAAKQVPEFASDEERLKWMVEQQVKSIVAPMQTKMQQTEADAELERVVNYNATLIDGLLKKKTGKVYDELTPAEQAAVMKSWATVHEEMKTQRKLTPALGNMIIGDALRNPTFKNSGNGAQKAADLNKQARVPHISPSLNSSKGDRPIAPPKLDGVPESERRRRMDVLLNPK